MNNSPEWWRGAIIYQIYPRSFLDSNGDGVGDLAGIQQKLDHVASLGVDAIWISPFFKSPMKDFGYDVSDYRDVDPVFGTLDDFKNVLNRAHDLGLKVLIDQVWSHTSDQHDWFKESRLNRDNTKHDWYVWADPKPDGTAPNNWLSWFGGIAWTWDSRRMQYYLHHFLKEQPALNLWNPEVRKAIKNVAAFWLDMGVDGFRLDVSNLYLADAKLRDNPPRDMTLPLPADPPPSNPYIRQTCTYNNTQPENISLIEELRAFVNQWPDRCLLAEAGICDNSEIVAADYTKKGNRFHQCYSFGLLGTDMSKAPVLRAVTAAENALEDGWICWAINNHDFRRVTGRMKGEVTTEDKALYSTALGLMLRGSYCMFQGEELGLPNAELAFEELRDPYDISLYPHHVGRDGPRTPMPWMAAAPHAGFSTSTDKPWLPLWPAHVSLAVDVQEKDENATLSHIKKLMAWRRETPAMRLGTIELFDLPDPILGFRRSYEGQTFTCVYNASYESTFVKKETLGPVQKLLEISRNAALHNESLMLSPYGYAIFSH